MSKVYVQWNGGSSYSPSDIDDREVFPSVREAKWALEARREQGGHYQQRFNFVHKHPESAFTPAAYDSYMDLYTSADAEEMFARLEFGPRGGIVQQSV